MGNWKISSFGWHGITGVYCVCTINQEKKVSVQYIGSSKDIGKRLANNYHPYRIIYNKGFLTFIKYREVENYKELEKAMIKKIKPKYTIHHNG